jgi:hypothetical protein
MAGVERACFELWCALLDGHGQARPDEVTASQLPLHDAAEALRDWCLADPEQAEAERMELLRRQAEGDISSEAAATLRRAATDRAAIRQAWVSERYRILQARAALDIGLGWPHRGEPVTATVTYWAGNPAEEATMTGAGIYLDSYDIHNVSHQVWMPEISANHRHGSHLVTWINPGSRRRPQGNADPAGDIDMRVTAAESRRLPAPLPRWPQAEDIAGGVDPLARYAPGAQMDLF